MGGQVATKAGSASGAFTAATAFKTLGPTIAQ
jgi:hypothetical protein